MNLLLDRQFNSSDSLIPSALFLHIEMKMGIEEVGLLVFVRLSFPRIPFPRLTQRAVHRLIQRVILWNALLLVNLILIFVIPFRRS